MRVLIIATNRERFPHGVAPVGAASIVSTLQAAGYETEFLDLYFERSVPRAIAKTLARFQPDVVGFSVRNLDNAAYIGTRSYAHDTKLIVDEVRKHSDAVLIAGGSAVSIGGIEFLEYLNVPYGVIGEGEQSILMFLQAVAGTGRFEDVPGLMRLRGACEAPLVTPARFDSELSTLHVNQHSPIEYHRYYGIGGLVNIQTKRGCPYKCVFCNYPALEGDRHRVRPAEQCVDDVERVVRETGHRDFFFVDSVFNQPIQHARAICEEIVRRNLKIRWMAYFNPLGITRDFAVLLKKSGCVGVELGIDSATEKMLAANGKCFKQSAIRKAYDALHFAGLPFAVFLLFGGEGETWTDVQETQDYLTDAGKANAVFACLGMRIFRDTSLYRTAIAEGVVAAETPLVEPLFYVSKELGERPIEKLNEIARQNPTWTTPTDWETLPVRTAIALAKKFRVLPEWKRVEDYGKYMRRPKKRTEAQ